MQSSRARSRSPAGGSPWLRRKRLSTVAVMVTAALALAGCWPVPGQNPDRTAYNPFEGEITPQTVGSLEQLWLSPQYLQDVSPAVVSEGGVFVTAFDTLFRIDADTGSVDWHTGVQPIGSPNRIGIPHAVQGKVLLGSQATPWQAVRPSRPAWFDLATGASLGPAGSAAGIVDSVRGGRAVVTRRTLPARRDVVLRVRCLKPRRHRRPLQAA